MGCESIEKKTRYADVSQPNRFKFNKFSSTKCKGTFESQIGAHKTLIRNQWHTNRNCFLSFRLQNSFAIYFHISNGRWSKTLPPTFSGLNSYTIVAGVFSRFDEFALFVVDVRWPIGFLKFCWNSLKKLKFKFSSKKQNRVMINLKCWINWSKEWCYLLFDCYYCIKQKKVWLFVWLNVDFLFWKLWRKS